jgi:WD40 repeat protein
LSSSGIVLTSDDGIVRIIDVKGHAQVAIGTHGPAASLDEDVPEGETAAMARARRALREADRGSSMIKDVCVIPGTRTVVSVGFDKTIRILQPEG